jgi:hypothetical protein
MLTAVKLEENGTVADDLGVIMRQSVGNGMAAAVERMWTCEGFSRVVDLSAHVCVPGVV